MIKGKKKSIVTFHLRKFGYFYYFLICGPPFKRDEYGLKMATTIKSSWTLISFCIVSLQWLLRVPYSLDNKRKQFSFCTYIHHLWNIYYQIIYKAVVKIIKLLELLLYISILDRRNKKNLVIYVRISLVCLHFRANTNFKVLHISIYL